MTVNTELKSPIPKQLMLTQNLNHSERGKGGRRADLQSVCLLTGTFRVKGLGLTKRPLGSHSADLTGCTYLHLQIIETNLKQINYLLITTNCATWKSNKTA